jgi:ADP-ribose pyrophosphatase YjhB (NUDIX family)
MSFNSRRGTIQRSYLCRVKGVFKIHLFEDFEDIDMPSKVSSVTRIIVKDPEGKILVKKMSDGQLDLPGGHVDDGETLHKCAARELKEECGCRILGKAKALPGNYVVEHRKENCIVTYLVANLDPKGPKACALEPHCKGILWMEKYEIFEAHESNLLRGKMAAGIEHMLGKQI